MKHLRITVEGKTYDVQVETINEGNPAGPASYAAPVASAAAALPIAAPSPSSAPIAADGDVTSPLAGVVEAVEVAVGAKVNAGDLIITLEAMKMVTYINAPGAGTVTAIHVKPGDAVDEGEPLYSLG